MNFTPNARTVLEKRYLKKDENGRTETPEALFRRVAKNIAAVDGAKYGKSPEEVSELEETFYRLMTECDFMPNSPTLMNAGRELQQLSACFVLPIEDSMESIFETLKHTALIHQTGGGTGFSFSRLRPKNDVVRSTGGVASGPVSFIKVYDAATNSVKQGGMRRGANMGILRVDHPDILEFIRCKSDSNEITNFNLSVGITDEFLKALAEDSEYDLINPRTGTVVERLRAKAVFDLIVEMAWTNGEPGVIFLDRLNADNPTPHIGRIESTNPCGEQPLLPYESCNLASINLGKFVINGEDGTPAVDWKRLGSVVHDVIHFLDNVIDANKYPLPQIEQMTLGNRKVGLGVMGWADMLIKLGIPYDTEEAVAFGERMMKFIRDESRKASHLLALERGPFPNWEGSALQAAGLEIQRNATTTTIAPTGTVSIIAGASSGIEPLFSVAFTRLGILDGEPMVEVNPLFEEKMRELDLYTPELMETIARAGSLRNVSGIPDEVTRLFVTALDIAPEWHVRMQAAFQKYTDNAVSKTVNLPNSATRSDVAKIFTLAYELGCKGVTIYRDGSRESQVLNVGDRSRSKSGPAGVGKQTPDTNGTWGNIRPVRRPRELSGITVRKETPVGKLFLTLNTFQGRPFELFAQIGKAGSDVTAFTEAVARLVSLAFRCGVAPEEVAEQLVGIGGSRSIGFGRNRVRSVPDAIGQFIVEYLAQFNRQLARGGADEVAPAGGDEKDSGLPVSESAFSKAAEVGSAGPDAEPVRGQLALGFNLCPVCGMQTLVHVEGCSKCMACGHSEC